MKLIVMKCPECKSDLEMEEGRKSCFCSYCGCKIIIDDEKQETTINKNYTYTEHYINEAEVIEAKSNETNRTRDLIVGIVLVLAAIIFLVGIFGFAKHSSDVEEEKLQAIVDEVMIDIENGDFQEAYIKANKIHYSSDFSDEIEEKWDETREELLKQIKKAEKEATGKSSIFEWFN